MFRKNLEMKVQRKKQTKVEITIALGKDYNDFKVV